MLADLRYAFRSLRSAPGFTATAVLTLALGLGATTAIYSVVHAVLIRPLPVPEAHQLAAVVLEDRRGAQHGLSPELVDALATAPTFSVVTPLTGANGRFVSHGEPRLLNGFFVRPEFFRLMRVSPVAGRVFDGADQNEILISHRLWTEHFGGDAGIIGSSVMFEPSRVRIVGILPAGFSYPDLGPAMQTDFWRPLVLDESEPALHGAGAYDAIARLQPSVTFERASADAAVVLERLRRVFPKDYENLSVRLIPLLEFQTFWFDKVLWPLLGAVACVLLIACGNVTSLMLARGVARTREMSVRASVGASRARLVRQHLFEVAIVVVAACALGVVAASYTVAALVALPGIRNFPRIGEARIDTTVLLVTAGVAAATTVLVGLWPAVRLTRAGLTAQLRGAGTTTAPLQARRSIAAFVGVQIALTVVLLAGTGALVLTLQKLLAVDIGIREQPVLTARISPGVRYRDDARRWMLWQRIVQEVERVPGVLWATIASLPPGQFASAAAINVDGGEPPVEMTSNVRWRAVLPEYFSRLGIRIEAGREFLDTDRAGTEPVIVISRRARDLFPAGTDPIGRRVSVRAGGRVVQGTIVGIAADVRSTRWREPLPEFYVHAAQVPPARASLLIRTTVASTWLADAVKRAVWRVDHQQPVVNIIELAELLDRQVAQQRSQAVLIGAFGAVGVLLSVVGIVAVVIYAVSLRTREIGIRLALGAKPAHIICVLTGQTMGGVIAGLATGLWLSVWFTRWLEDMLYEVRPGDPRVLGTIAVMVLGLTTAAAVISARRAQRIDPAITLRAE